MISALSHFLYLPNLEDSGCTDLRTLSVPGQMGTRQQRGRWPTAAGQKPRLAWRVCVKGWMKDPGSFLGKLHGVVGGGLRAQVETPEQAKAVWQASWHCGSLVEAGVSRKSTRWQHREHRAAGDTARDGDGEAGGASWRRASWRRALRLPQPECTPSRDSRTWEGKLRTSVSENNFFILEYDEYCRKFRLIEM